jgi:hypothetical protein
MADAVDIEFDEDAERLRRELSFARADLARECHDAEIGRAVRELEAQLARVERDRR